MRRAAAECMAAVLAASDDCKELDVFIPYCAKALSDVDDEVRCSYSNLLGTMLAAACSLDPAKVAASKKKKSSASMLLGCVLCYFLCIEAVV